MLIKEAPTLLLGLSRLGRHDRIVDELRAEGSLGPAIFDFPRPQALDQSPHIVDLIPRANRDEFDVARFVVERAKADNPLANVGARTMKGESTSGAARPSTRIAVAPLPRGDRVSVLSALPSVGMLDLEELFYPTFPGFPIVVGQDRSIAGLGKGQNAIFASGSAQDDHYLSTQTSSMRQPLKILLTITVSPFTYGCQQVALRS
jgi:hypothetical protein